MQSAGSGRGQRSGLKEEACWGKVPGGGGRAGAAGGGTNVGRGGELCEAAASFGPPGPATVAPWQVWSHGFGKERGVRAVHDC